MNEKQPEMDIEIVEELGRLNEHLRVKGEMHTPAFTSKVSVSRGTFVSSDAEFPRSVFTSRGLTALQSVTALDYDGYRDQVRGPVSKSAANLRERLKDRYPAQYEEWKLGTNAYRKKLVEQARHSSTRKPFPNPSSRPKKVKRV